MDDRAGGAVGRRDLPPSDRGPGYNMFDNPTSGFVDDYRGGPGSGYLPTSRRHGSGLGAFGSDEDARPANYRGIGPKNYARSDRRIHEDVCDRLTDDPHIDASEIEVSVNNGEVTLAGHVQHRDDKRRAEDIADAVAGVRHVQNNLRVGGPNQASAQRTAGADRAAEALGQMDETVGEQGSSRRRTRATANERS